MRLVLVPPRVADDLVQCEFEFVEPDVDGEYPWLVRVDTLLLAARAGHLQGFGLGEMANMRVSLDNRDKQASSVLGYALRLRARVYDDDDELYFAGSVQRVDYGYPLVLTLES